MSRHLQTLFLLAVLSFLFVIPTQAQVTTASMSGTVMFQDEPVIGATVSAVHEPSGANYGTITNVDGRFSRKRVQEVQPYKVMISCWLSITKFILPHYPVIGREPSTECC